LLLGFGFPADLEGAFFAGFAAGFLAAGFVFFAGMVSAGLELMRMGIFSRCPDVGPEKEARILGGLARKRNRYSGSKNASEARILAGCRAIGPVVVYPHEH